MKMAKASQADLDAAIGICSALEAIDRGFMPEGFDTDDGDRADFDIDDARDCRSVLDHLLELVGKGSIGRVVWGMSVLLDPNNQAVDPDLDYIEHHPNRIEGNKAVEQRDELLAALNSAASVSHSGGLCGYAEDDVLRLVRVITRPYWDKSASDDKHRAIIAKAEAQS